MAAVNPGMISVAEVDAFTHRWVAGAKKFEERRGCRVCQVVAHELDEDHGARVVVVSDFQSESIGLVFEMTAYRKQRRPEHEQNQAKYKNEQRQRSEVREFSDTRARDEASQYPTRTEMDKPQARQ